MKRSFKEDVFYIWRNKYERSMYSDCFKPLFVRYIGVQEDNLYCDILKTINVKFNENKDKCIIFDGSIVIKGEFELIDFINRELTTMNVFDLKSQEITIFNNSEVNSVFLKSLDYVVNLALKNESFFNENVRNNFITKLIVWAYIYLKEINFDDNINPKCIYYGNIQRHEIYFLLMLHLMSFDVLYINPLKEDDCWENIDTDKITHLEKYMQILNIESFYEKANRGSLIEYTESTTKELKKIIEKELYTDTGMYRDWQFRKGYTKSLFLNSLLEDLKIYWKEQARFREGFKIEKDVVTVPCFFQKIEGMYDNEESYVDLVEACTKTSNTLIITDGLLSSDISVSDNMYELVFCRLSDGSFDVDKIKALEMYNFNKFSEEVQNLILNKFNETILDENLYSFKLESKDILQLLVLVLKLNESIVRLIDNFDFTKDVPKIVIFLNNEDILSNNMLLLLGYLHKIGMDIVIFNPSGLFNTDKVIKTDKINITRLQRMKYDVNYNRLKNKKKSFIARLFE